MFFFEKQRSLKCAIHAINNIVRNDIGSTYRRSFRVVDGKKPEDDTTINIMRVCKDILKEKIEAFHGTKKDLLKLKKDYACKSSGDYADEVVRRTLEEIDLTIEEYSDLLLDKPQLLHKLKNRASLENFLGFFLQTSANKQDHYCALLLRDGKLMLLDSLEFAPRQIRRVSDMDNIGMIWGIFDNDEERTDIE
jgi:hypothetical protein